MKEDMIKFFTKNPSAFGRFCVRLLEGTPCYWCDHRLTNAETREVYTAMREIFPGRKDG